MHRRPLIEALEAYKPFRDRDRASAEQTLAFVRATPDCFERSCLPGHVTGSAWVVDAAGGSALLTHHRKLDIWIQPGGHCDGDPDVFAVAAREAWEETGIAGLVPARPGIFDVDVHPFPERHGFPEHLHFDVRIALRAPADARFAVSDESHDLAWVPLDRLDAYTTDASVRRLRDRWVRDGG
ncbi:MAG: NUDIX hydrolase [Opitutales bacterium]